MTRAASQMKLEESSHILYYNLLSKQNEKTAKIQPKLTNPVDMQAHPFATRLALEEIHPDSFRFQHLQPINCKRNQK